MTIHHVEDVKRAFTRHDQEREGLLMKVWDHVDEIFVDVFEVGILDLHHYLPIVDNK